MRTVRVALLLVLPLLLGAADVMPSCGRRQRPIRPAPPELPARPDAGPPAGP